MNPGRELDALVAEKIFNLPQTLWREGKSNLNEDGSGLIILGVMPEPYSTDIAAAWEVVGKLKTLGFVVGVDIGNSDLSACVIAVVSKKHGDIREVVATEAHESAPHAICLAALKAVGVDV
jgi:hypothetical protein